MTTFDKRGKDEEAKYKRNEELKFKVNARRNKLLGLWAAEQMAFKGADAEAYAKQVVMADVEEAGDHDVFRKVRGDFDKAGVSMTDHQIQRQMTELMETAIAQMKSEKK